MEMREKNRKLKKNKEMEIKEKIMEKMKNGNKKK